MSGAIRRVVGPTRARLHHFLASWAQYPTPDFSSPNDIQQHIFDLTELRNRTANQITILEAQLQLWDKLLGSLPQTEKDEEEKIMQEFNTKNDEGVLGFIDLMLEGKDQLVRMDIRIDEWRHTLNSVERALISPKTASTPPTSESPPPAANVVTTNVPVLTTAVPVTSITVSRTTGQGSAGLSGPGLTMGQPVDWTTQPIFSTRVSTNVPITDSANLIHAFGAAPHPLPMAPIVRLPKLDLPEFSGDETKFFAFWESFESQINCDQTCPQWTNFDFSNVL